jgi:hypothetical protein
MSILLQSGLDMYIVIYSYIESTFICYKTNSRTRVGQDPHDINVLCFFDMNMS